MRVALRQVGGSLVVDPCAAKFAIFVGFQSLFIFEPVEPLVLQPIVQDAGSGDGCDHGGQQNEGGGGKPAAAAAEPAGCAAGPGLTGVDSGQVVGDGLKVGGQLGGRLIAVARERARGSADHGLECGGDFGVAIAEPGQRAQPLVDGLQQGLDDRRAAARRGEGALAGHGLVEHDAQAVDVGAAVDTQCDERLAQRLEMLGRHVVDRPAQGGRIGGGSVLGHGLARQVEVKQHRHAVGGDQHVRRLDVAVEHAAVVGMGEGLGQPGAPPGDRPRVRPPRQARAGRPSCPPASSPAARADRAPRPGPRPRAAV